MQAFKPMIVAVAFAASATFAETGTPPSSAPQSAPQQAAPAVSPVRVAQTSAAEASAGVAPAARTESDPWLLLLSGVALVGWVAHRRLVNSFG